MQEQNQIAEQEIDIFSIIKRLWVKKIFITRITIIFAFIGVFVALSSPKVYTSSCVFVPQSSKKSSGGGLSSLAALAGISLGDMSTGESLSPVIYPQIFENIDFKKELMYSEIKLQDTPIPVKLIDYYTDPRYSKINLLAVIKKYTIGLPAVILNTFKKEFNHIPINSLDNAVKFYNEKEFYCAEMLNKSIGISLEEKKGYITIYANMSEPLAAAQLCQLTYNLLQEYVTKFKIQKAENQRRFIIERYEETKSIYEEKQINLATFKDANKMISSAQAQIEYERLLSEYNMANAIYTEMAKQRLQSDIQVKEDTPVLSVVKPAVVPFQKSGPKKSQIVIIWILFGIFLSSGIVICCDWLKSQGVENKLINKMVL